MAQHLILRGAGAEKWLPFARAQLKNLRETLGLYAFDRFLRVTGAAVRLRWAGDEEWIYIIGVGERIFGLSSARDKVIALREIAGGNVTRPFGFETVDFRVVRGPAPVGNRRLLYLKGLRDSPISPVTYTAYDSLDGGASMRLLPVSFAPTTGFLSPAYGGPAFVDDKAAGARYLIAATAAIGIPLLSYSDDSGRTWHSTTMNFFPSDPATDCIFSTPIPIGRNKLLAMGGRLVSGKLLVVRSENGGGSWDTLAATGLSVDLNTNGLFWGTPHTGIESLGIGKLVAFGKGKILYFVYLKDGSAARSYTSLDGGETWSAPTTALTDAEATLGVSVHSDPLVIGQNSAIFRYTPNAFFPEDGETRIVRTLDSGASWQHLPPVAPGKLPSQIGIPEFYSRSEDPTKCVLMMPVFDVDATYLYVSRNSGESWTKGPKLISGDELGTGNAFFHLGLPRQPQPADIGATGLYSPD